MEDYNWNKDLLIKEKKRIKYKLLRKNICEKEKREYEIYYNNVIDMINTLNNKMNLSEEFPQLFLPLYKIENTMFRSIYNTSTEFQRNVIKDFYKITSSYKINNFKNCVIYKKISMEHQKDLIMKTFNNNKKIVEMNNKILNNKNNLLRINKNTDENFFAYTDKNGYIINSNNESVEGFLSLCHELGHYDSYVMNGLIIDKNIFVNHNGLLFNYSEISSLFYELIAADSLIKNNIINEYDKGNLFGKIDLVNSCSVDDYIKILSIFENNLKMSLKTKLQYKFGEKINDISMYYYSYLIAVYLFNIYKKDPEKAFYNMNYIINNITPQNEIKLLNNCNVNFEDKDIINNHIELIKGPEYKFSLK